MRATKLSSAAIIVFALTLLSACPLRADGTDNYIYRADGNTFTWQLPANPNPNSSSPMYDTFSNLALTENGTTITATLDFYSNIDGGGFDIWAGSSADQGPLVDAYGQQLYWGPIGFPTMLTGNFFFWDFAGNDNNPCEPPYGGMLQVSAVPEPSAMLLLLVGLVTALGISALRKN